MTTYELRDKMPELTKNLGYYTVADFLKTNGIPFKTSIFGDDTISQVDAEKALKIYRNLLIEKKEEDRIEKIEADRKKIEADRKKRAMANILITSGFNFDGYHITKYSGYISGDDAMTVERGSSFTDGGVRDKLMASLTQIRRNALRELKEAAYDLGCNAVIGVDFDYITLDPQTANLAGGTTYQPYVFCVTANGNAVVIEKIEE